MDKRLRIAGIVGALAFSIIILTSPSDPLPLPEPISDTQNNSVEVLATHLKNPRAIAVYDNRIFVTEKQGNVIVVQDDQHLDSPLATLRPAEIFDGGLSGIAVHPNFSENHFIYVFFTYEDQGKLWNKILRITESDNKLVDAVTIFDKIPASQFSNGGFLKFGPDDKLYVGTGVVSDSSHLSQDLDSLSGKILRINDDGSIPDDNPFPNSPVFSLGHRNPQGMAWDSEGQMFLAELGPEKNDEINLIESGKNYGWPEQQCRGGNQFEDAIMCYDPSIEPGGIIFYDGDKIDLENSFVLASLRASNLFQLDLDTGLESQKSILGGVGRVRDVVQGQDGSIYVITSNTDGKGFPESSDDKLLRILR